MSDSTENTNELDSYGVWVKNSKQEEPADDLNFTDSLDLPDFEESTDLDEADFSDMFKEDDTLNLDSSADDTTLTDDELLNITNGDGIEIAEEPFTEQEESLDDISFDSLEENSVSDADLSDFVTEEPASESPDDMSELNIPEVSIEDPSETDEAPAEETTLDDFSFDEITDPAANTEPETTEEEVTEEFGMTDSLSEEVSVEDFGVDEASDDSEQEISLDDFMDEGFSDESVASGNNGFAADAAPASSDSEEVSLDDFVDMSEFGVSEDAPKKEEAIVDEKPLDMDISFDSSADAIQTEENIEDNGILSDDFDDTEEPEEQAPAFEEEDVAASSGSNDIEAEEVDLSDFGIDADAEETPVTQDIEGSKLKDTVVDYDLSVDNDHMSAAPIVNEIKSNANAQSEADLEEIADAEEVSMSKADSGLLQQIVEDLSNLKAEINSLKTNLEEMKSAPVASPAESSGVISEEIAVEDDIIDDSADNADTGFFSGDDGDDTIALSTDELSNILNTADFNSEEEVVAEESADEAVEETAVDEPVVEETVEEEPAVEESFVEETPEQDFSIEENIMSSEGPLDEGIIADEIAADNFQVPEQKASDLTYDFTDENLNEPNLDDIEIDEDTLEDDLPDEISIPKDDNILVESSSSDFMESVQDTTEEHAVEEAPVEVPVEEPAAEPEFSTVDNLFYESNGFADIADDSAPVEEEPVIEESFEPDVEETAEPEAEAEPEPQVEDTDFDVIEEEEPTIEEETFVPEEEVMEGSDETVIPEPALENDFVSHEDDNNNLTDSNIDYLTTEDKDIEPEADENAELKKDIKSVLLYMDQLLENLPEEKIVEFAKSDEFTTYKKLFSELGLS